MRLLVADDDADMRQSMRLLLERAGHEVGLAQNGAKALELQRTRPADVLITDIFMPESDGLETIERFRREFPGVRIIAMSGGGVRFKGETFLETASIAGADAVLRKPFDKRVLLDTLRGLAPAPR
ncbi:MAG TPA: response regulator [Burkholderiales bacterium]